MTDYELVKRYCNLLNKIYGHKKYFVTNDTDMNDIVDIDDSYWFLCNNYDNEIVDWSDILEDMRATELLDRLIELGVD